MRFTDLYIAGTGVRLAPAVATDEAVQRGWCDSRAVWRTGIEAVRISESESGPAMAANAAATAVRRAGVPPESVDLLLHASTYYQGHDMWAPSSYVQRAVLGGCAPAYEVRQMSNGGLAALELASGHLLADPVRTHALITTGDRFCPPGFDRWTSDPGTVYADGGAALVLSTTGGPVQLVSLATFADPGLEAMQRHGDPSAAAALEHRRPLDVGRGRRGFTAEIGLDALLSRIDAGQSAALDRALDDADLKIADIDRFVLPNLGRARLDAHFLDPFTIDPERTTWEWGRHVGHLGAGDQIAGLDHLLGSGGLLPGQHCLLIGVGAGFTWSAAVVRMLRVPEGSATP